MKIYISETLGRRDNDRSRTHLCVRKGNYAYSTVKTRFTAPVFAAFELRPDKKEFVYKYIIELVQAINSSANPPSLNSSIPQALLRNTTHLAPFRQRNNLTPEKKIPPLQNHLFPPPEHLSSSFPLHQKVTEPATTTAFILPQRACCQAPSRGLWLWRAYVCNIPGLGSFQAVWVNLSIRDDLVVLKMGVHFTTFVQNVRFLFSMVVLETMDGRMTCDFLYLTHDISMLLL